MLKDLQGEDIPRCYGFYTIEFKDRELADDRYAFVIITEKLAGIPLYNYPCKDTLNHQQKLSMAAQVRDLLLKANQNGLLMHNVDATNFVVGNQRKLKLFGFLGTQPIGRYEALQACQKEAVEDLLLFTGLQDIQLFV
jgi:hypothetical protein